jgi:hypothetical protein
MHKIKTVKQRLRLKKLSIARKVQDEITHWIDYEVDDKDIWGNAPLKDLVNGYLNNLDIDKGIIREDEFDGIRHASEYHVIFIVDQVGYKLKIELDVEKQASTLSTVQLVKLVLKAKGLVK